VGTLRAALTVGVEPSTMTPVGAREPSVPTTPSVGRATEPSVPMRPSVGPAMEPSVPTMPSVGAMEPSVPTMGAEPAMGHSAPVQLESLDGGRLEGGTKEPDDDDEPKQLGSVQLEPEEGGTKVDDDPQLESVHSELEGGTKVDDEPSQLESVHSELEVGGTKLDDDPQLESVHSEEMLEPELDKGRLPESEDEPQSLEPQSELMMVGVPVQLEPTQLGVSVGGMVKGQPLDPHMDSMELVVGGEMDTLDADRQACHAELTDSCEVCSFQLQPSMVTLCAPMSVPEKPKSCMLGRPFESQTWLMKLAMWWSYVAVRPDTWRMSSLKLSMTAMLCEVTMVWVSTSQIWVVMTSLAYSRRIESCCWMMVMSMVWHCTTVSCEKVCTLDEPQKLSALPNQLSKSLRALRPPHPLNEWVEPKLLIELDSELKVSGM